mmetsp:Transcript_52814/g.133443  ORF Transcript_52814/g.133443 Transcript_52814/m.133443 type:complete len:100 (-) Transcript_52814:725-1024(-)
MLEIFRIVLALDMGRVVGSVVDLALRLTLPMTSPPDFAAPMVLGNCRTIASVARQQHARAYHQERSKRSGRMGRSNAKGQHRGIIALLHARLVHYPVLH